LSNREIELEMSERATRVGVKVKPPTLIVIYSVHLDKIQNRIRKIPLKDIDNLTAREIAIRLKSRQNHATLLSTINVEKLVSILSKLPNVKNPISGSVEVSEASQVSSSPNQQSGKMSDKSSAESSEKLDLGATGPFEIPQVQPVESTKDEESKRDELTEDSISEKSISEESHSILSERPEIPDSEKINSDSESKASSEDEKSISEDSSKENISEKNPATEKSESEKPKKSNFDFLDSDSDSEQKSMSKKSDDLLDFLSKPVETKKTNHVISADQEKLNKINDTIAKIDDTNFDFLNSTDDENSFKPLDQKVKKSNFSFLDSDQSEDESERKDDKSDWTKTDKTETQMSSDDDSKSEVSDKSESESENPFLKNLMAAQKAQNRSRSNSESSISSNYSEKSESKMFENSQLNGLSDDELDRVKEKMEKKFSANQLKPGDDGFEYDKQVDFKPTQDCEWDDSLAD